MIKIGNFEVEENKIILIITLDATSFLNNFSKEYNILETKLPRFFNVKKALKDNYNHEYVKNLNFDINKKMKDLNNKERDLLEFLLKIFNNNIILLDRVPNSEMLEIIKKSNKTCIITSNNLDDIKIADYVYLIKDNKLKEYKEIKDKYIKIKGSSINKALFPLKHMKIDHFNADEIEFVYFGNIDELTPYLCKIKIDDLEIRNLKLEEIYKYYYKK